MFAVLWITYMQKLYSYTYTYCVLICLDSSALRSKKQQGSTGGNYWKGIGRDQQKFSEHGGDGEYDG